METIRDDSIKFLQGLQMMIQRDIDTIKTLPVDSIIDYMFTKSYSLSGTTKLEDFRKVMEYNKNEKNS